MSEKEERLNVYQMILAVQAALAEKGVGKGQQTPAKAGGYMYRGIDDVYNALAPVLAKVGLVIKPEVEARQVTERTTAAGSAIFYVCVKVVYEFVSSHDGSSTRVTVIAEGMDTGDKATNKAMSAAYKYACFQTFCIPLEGSDSEADNHNVVSEELITPDQADELVDMIADAGLDSERVLAWLNQMAGYQINDMSDIRAKNYATVRNKINRLIDERAA